MERAKARIATRNRLQEPCATCDVGEYEELLAPLLPLLLTTMPQEETMQQAQGFKLLYIVRTMPVGVQDLVWILTHLVDLTRAQHNTTDELHQPAHRLRVHPVRIDSTNAAYGENKTFICSNGIEGRGVNERPMDMEVFVLSQKMVDVVGGKNAF
jgi:hypothetical protein